MEGNVVTEVESVALAVFADFPAFCYAGFKFGLILVVFLQQSVVDLVVQAILYGGAPIGRMESIVVVIDSDCQRGLAFCVLSAASAAANASISAADCCSPRLSKSIG